MFKRIKFIVFVFIYPYIALIASTNDTIWTQYKDGEFTTQCQQRVKVSNRVGTEVADYLVTDFDNSPGHLFNWALKDLGLQNKGNELIIVFKSSNKDLNTGITLGVFDIIVPNVTSFKDVRVKAIVSKTKYKNGINKVTADIIYSALLLDKAYCVFTVVPQKNNEQLFVSNIKIKFGWFFNLFITQRRYKSIVEWRIKKFVENMKDEAERRENKPLTPKG
jgi:hypothetical protein